MSIAIVSYNVAEMLADCLQSLIDSRGTVSFRITVVDNASSDATCDMLRAQFPQVELIANEENIGFAAANNQAMSMHECPYVMLLNPDTLVKPGTIAALHDVMESNPEIGILGPKILNPDGTLQSGPLFFPTLASLALGIQPTGDKHVEHSSGSAIVDADWTLGACMMVRQEVIHEIGLMDEGYFLYGEEKDWCFRAKQAGWRVCVLMDADIVHYGGQSTAQRGPESYEAFIDSQVRFHSKFYQGSMNTVFLATTLLRAALMEATAYCMSVVCPRNRPGWRARARIYSAGRRRAHDYLVGRRRIPVVK